MQSRFKSLLGLCLKARKLAVGHDAVKTSVKQRKSELIILTSDASERLFDEMSTLTGGKNILRLNLTMEDISAAIGKRSGVLSINDEGFARVISDETTKEGFII